MGIEVKIKKNLESFSLDMDFSEASGRIGILGASGAGKSMLLKSLAGIEHPDEGRIAINDRVVFDSSSGTDIKPQGRRVGYLFQNYALFPHMSVVQNICAGLRGKDRGAIERRVREMVEKFRLRGFEDRFPSQLSGGQQQRVALARIMAYEPEVILLDEPFSALDVYLRDRMQTELMEMLEDYGGIVIMVSHSRDEIFRMSEALLILDQGKIVSHGVTKDVFRNPVSKSAAVLTGCKNFSSVTVIDDHTMRAEDWGIELKVSKKIPEGTTCIGYRAHEFIPVWGERGENSIRFNLHSKAELPFEKNYYICPEKEDFEREALITWFVQRDRWEELEEKGYPSFLRFKEEDILFLK